MCIDSDKRNIYVFGGKILTPRSVSNTTSNEPEYSGLFSYHIATNTWTQILVDCHHPSAAQADVLSIKSRITHCMVFHTVKNIPTLYEKFLFSLFFLNRNIVNCIFMVVSGAKKTSMILSPMTWTRSSFQC